jgi:hypothetical protein
MAIFALLAWMPKGSTVLKIPQESTALSYELAKRFSDTEIPEFVLAYGIHLFCT